MYVKKILTGEEQGYWFVCSQSKIWLPKGEVPVGFANALNLTGLTAQKIGEINNKVAWIVYHDVKSDMSTIRTLLSVSEQTMFLMAGRAVQLARFYESHQFCGYCGEKMYHSKTEWCCLCDNCNQSYYPQISPSIIVAIRRENQILLAKHTRHINENIYTVLAGFVEIGETIEQAVKREVYEESKIKIKNIRYVTSQPWPFPNSMMLAFLADYHSGEIEVDKNELSDANWYHYNNLPNIPEYNTVARRLIEDTIILCRDAETNS